MALSKGSSAIYLSIADGQLIRQHKTPTADTEERKNKNDKIVHEEKFRNLTGIISFVAKKEGKFGPQWEITFVDGNENYVVQMFTSNRYATSFLKALPNVDLKEKVTFSPWSMQDGKDNTKTVTGVTMYQHGDKVFSYYTKEDPKGLPQMTQIKVKGKMVWDSSDMDEFLEAMVLKIFPKSAAPATSTTSTPAATGGFTPAATGDEPPF